MTPTFTILATRRRAIIALIHTLVFLALAVHDLVGSARLAGVVGPHPFSAGATILAVIYVIVTAVLVYLFWLSRGAVERLYFCLCSASAASGLLRAILGDAGFSLGRYLRVGLLLGAVFAVLTLMQLVSESSQSKQFRQPECVREES